MKSSSAAVFASGQNARTLRRLESLGHGLILLPAVECELRELSEEERSDLESPGGFDWVIFSDERAVELFGEIAERSPIDLYGYDQPVVAALGEAVADRLRFLQLHADVIPSKLDRDTVFEAICVYAGGSQKLKGAAILVVASAAMERIPIGCLTEAAAEVRTVVLSDCRISDPRELTRINAICVGGGIDLVYFDSSRDVLDHQIFSEKHGVDLLACGSGAACGDELTRAALGELGIEARII